MQSDVFDAAWQRLITAGDERVRAIATQLYVHPVARKYFPYASHSNLRLSRNAEFPWDDIGLPFIVSRPDDDMRYEARDGTFKPTAVGDLATVVAAVIALLAKP